MARAPRLTVKLYAGRERLGLSFIQNTVNVYQYEDGTLKFAENGKDRYKLLRYQWEGARYNTVSANTHFARAHVTIFDNLHVGGTGASVTGQNEVYSKAKLYLESVATGENIIVGIFCSTAIEVELENMMNGAKAGHVINGLPVPNSIQSVQIEKQHQSILDNPQMDSPLVKGFICKPVIAIGICTFLANLVISKAQIGTAALYALILWFLCGCVGTLYYTKVRPYLFARPVVIAWICAVVFLLIINRPLPLINIAACCIIAMPVYCIGVLINTAIIIYKRNSRGDNAED